MSWLIQAATAVALGLGIVTMAIVWGVPNV